MLLGADALKNDHHPFNNTMPVSFVGGIDANQQRQIQ
jgi:hypothetical protein